MIDYLVANKEMVALAVIGVVIAAILIVKVVQKVGLDKIRLYAYKWFEDAEREFQYGDNTEKFEYVINLAKSAIPSPFNLFITENLLRKVVQAWFDLCKDLLDDGELNGIAKEEVNDADE